MMNGEAGDDQGPAAGLSRLYTFGKERELSPSSTGPEATDTAVCRRGDQNITAGTTTPQRGIDAPEEAVPLV